MSKLKIAGISLLVVVLLIGLAFTTEWGNILWQRYFGPKKEDVKREVWEQTKSRVQGAAQEISKRRIEYIKSDDLAEKKAIAEYIRQSYAGIDPEDINDYQLRQFFKKCKNGTY